MSNGLLEAKATPCGRCGTTHVPPSKGGTCPALKEEADDVKIQKIMHKGKHVASIHTFKGRGGGMTSGTHNPDGSPAHKKYGIDPFDTKREQIKKIKEYHKNVKESTMKSFGAFVAESQEINEAHDVELKPHENGTHYIVHKIHPKSGIESDQLKKGEKISDSHVDDLHDMGYSVKIHKK